MTELGNIAFGVFGATGHKYYQNIPTTGVMLWGGFYAQIVNGRGFNSPEEIASALLGNVLGKFEGDICDVLNGSHPPIEQSINILLDQIAAFDLAYKLTHNGQSILEQWDAQFAPPTWREAIRNAFSSFKEPGGALSVNEVKDCKRCGETTAASNVQIAPNGQVCF